MSKKLQLPPDVEQPSKLPTSPLPPKLADDAGDVVKIIELEHRLAEAETERDRYKAGLQEMVDKAAANKLDGYRELGRKAAQAETERDEARKQLAELRKKIHGIVVHHALGEYDGEDIALREELRMAIHPYPTQPEPESTDCDPGEGWELCGLQDAEQFSFDGKDWIGVHDGEEVDHASFYRRRIVMIDPPSPES